jgi:hypothetical protein
VPHTAPSGRISPVTAARQERGSIRRQDGDAPLVHDPFATDALGKPDFVPAAANPALVLDGGARLRLFMSVTGRTSIYALDQADQGGGLCLETFCNFQAP